MTPWLKLACLVSILVMTTATWRTPKCLDPNDEFMYMSGDKSCKTCMVAMGKDTCFKVGKDGCICKRGFFYNKKGVCVPGEQCKND